MKKLRQYWYELQTSLWFLPGIMLGFSIILALALVEVDGRVNRELLLEYPRIFGLGADGSRGMLTAIAGSMLTVAALAFSLTLSIIAQASGQYSPRILRNFMRDRVNQFILGYFVSVFAYCLVVLRTIRGADEIKFVPSLAAVIGLVLALGGILVLIYFIHHIATSLQVTNIIHKILEDTLDGIETLFPKGVGNPAEEEHFEEAKEMRKEDDWYEIPAQENGYAQYVDTDGLLEYAIENNIVIKMEQGIGQFIGSGEVLAKVAPDANTKAIIVKEEMIDSINSYYQIFRHRSIEQDIGYGIRQIVDIALKALSPGINDTTTAIICIDYLGVIVSSISARTLPANIRIKNGEVRVWVYAPTFESFVKTAFDQIRINGKGNQAIFQRLCTSLAMVGKNTQIVERKFILLKQLELIDEFAHDTLQTQYEKDELEKAIVKTRKTLNP